MDYTYTDKSKEINLAYLQEPIVSNIKAGEAENNFNRIKYAKKFIMLNNETVYRSYSKLSSLISTFKEVFHILSINEFKIFSDSFRYTFFKGLLELEFMRRIFQFAISIKENIQDLKLIPLKSNEKYFIFLNTEDISNIFIGFTVSCLCNDGKCTYDLIDPLGEYIGIIKITNLQHILEEENGSYSSIKCNLEIHLSDLLPGSNRSNITNDTEIIQKYINLIIKNNLFSKPL